MTSNHFIPFVFLEPMTALALNSRFSDLDTQITANAVSGVSLSVKNNSGAAAVAGDVGLLQYDAVDGVEYITTTTAEDFGSWCSVVAGGADGASIAVVQRGNVILNYTGSAPAIGDFLTTSATAGLCQARSTPHFNMMALATAAGSGGTVEALLITQTTPAVLVPGQNIFDYLATSTSDFVATINGAPAGSDVVYNAPSSGAEDVLDNNSSAQLAKQVLHNTTRGDSANISSVDTGTNTITLTDTVPVAWASGDSITVRSQTNTQVGSGSYYMDFNLSEQSKIPILARRVVLESSVRDTGAAGRFLNWHPFESYVGARRSFMTTQVSGQFLADGGAGVTLIEQKFTVGIIASGSGTMRYTFKLQGALVASP